MDEAVKRILDNHLSTNEMKPVSYLPSKTITNVLGMILDDYMLKARESGLCSVAFSESETCINSGAVYVYHKQYLETMLSQQSEILHENGWPSDTTGFIRQVASDWLNEEHPVLPVIRRAFGDLDQA